MSDGEDKGYMISLDPNAISLGPLTAAEIVFIEQHEQRHREIFQQEADRAAEAERIYREVMAPAIEGIPSEDVTAFHNEVMSIRDLVLARQDLGAHRLFDRPADYPVVFIQDRMSQEPILTRADLANPVGPRGGKPANPVKRRAQRQARKITRRHR